MIEGGDADVSAILVKRISIKNSNQQKRGCKTFEAAILTMKTVLCSIFTVRYNFCIAHLGSPHMGLRCDIYLGKLRQFYKTR